MVPRIPEHKAIALTVLIASVALLALEIAELRIFSYALDPLLVYSAISVALLGLGSGSIFITLRPQLCQGETRPRMVAALLGFAATALVSLALFARSSHTVGFGREAGLLGAALPVFTLLVAPYFCAGVLLSIAMTRDPDRIGLIYFANLVGSGLGCVLVLPLLRPFGVEAVVVICAALAILAALPLAWPLGWRRRAAVLGALALALAALPLAPRWFPFQPDPGDLYGVALEALRERYPGRDAEAYRPRREFAQWDPVSRVEIYAFPGQFGLINERAPVRFFTQDGGAGSMLVDVPRHPAIARALFEGSVYGGAYLLKPEPERVLIIGLGGAPDVLTALHHRARQITGVEINASAIAAVRGPFAALLGAPYAQPGVRILHRDGRSFVERSAQRFDVIQLTGADTYSAGSAGAFMFSENYLYTVEAMGRYLAALRPGGVLSIIRFGAESLRVISTELAALRARGVRQPARHIVVLQQGIWINVLLSRQPLERDFGMRLSRKLAALNRIERIRMPVYDALGFGLDDPVVLMAAPGLRLDNPFSRLLQAARRGREAAFLSRLALDYSPVTDDRPFFFQFLHLRQLPAVLSAAPDDYRLRGMRAHLLFLALVAAVAALLILLPLALRTGASLRRAGAARTLLYFVALGLGYLFVELILMQRCALLLGHPTYSIAAALFTLLIASGCGSAWSNRFAARRRTIAAAALGIVALLVVAQLALGPLFRALLPAPFALRLAALVAALAPLGFVMGIPFPVGLRAIAAQGRAPMAWALGINSFASVVASLVALPLAMFWGFAVVLLAAAGLYGLAALTAPSTAS
ncbi:MAG TPA: hypothetical protein VGB99_13170 [Acidobacteriota bacterium]